MTDNREIHHPLWGLRPGVCVRCKVSKNIATPSVLALSRSNDEMSYRVALALPDRCESCLADLGLSRKGVFVPVAETQSVAEALEAALKTEMLLAAERAAEVGKPKLY